MNQNNYDTIYICKKDTIIVWISFRSGLGLMCCGRDAGSHWLSYRLSACWVIQASCRGAGSVCVSDPKHVKLSCFGPWGWVRSVPPTYILQYASWLVQALLMLALDSLILAYRRESPEMKIKNRPWCHTLAREVWGQEKLSFIGQLVRAQTRVEVPLGLES